MKLNKGEWSEPYVALRLLGDGKLNIADENGRPKLGEWMDILELFRKETELRMVTYVRDSEVNVVDIDVNGARVASLPVSEFLEAADRLASEILNGKGSSFEASSEMKDFFLRAKMIFLKAKSIF